MMNYKLHTLVLKVATIKNDNGVHNLTDDELHYVCTKINKFYDDFDFENYEKWLELLTLNQKQYNWLEDLCTVLRELRDWEKC